MSAERTLCKLLQVYACCQHHHGEEPSTKVWGGLPEQRPGEEDHRLAWHGSWCVHHECGGRRAHGCGHDHAQEARGRARWCWRENLWTWVARSCWRQRLRVRPETMSLSSRQNVEGTILSRNLSIDLGIVTMAPNNGEEEIESSDGLAEEEIHDQTPKGNGSERAALSKNKKKKKRLTGREEPPEPENFWDFMRSLESWIVWITCEDWRPHSWSRGRC